MHNFIINISYLLQQAIPIALIGLTIGVAILIMLNRKRQRDGERFSKGQAVAILLLLCYFGGLVAITFTNRMDGMRSNIQFYPFLAFREAWNSFTLQVWLNPLLNIAMFIPLGVLLPLAAKPFRRWYWMLAAGAGTSFLVEAFQYFLSRGQADIDDLLCNTLGATLGYCLYMLCINLAGRQWKIAGYYAALPVLSIAALAGVFLAYHFQTYGNLEDAPIYAANTKGVKWSQECELSDTPEPSGVYWAEPFTKESCDEFAVEFLGRQGAEIHFGSPDVCYYDKSAFYSDHSTYSLSVNYNDRSYRYTDYRVDRELLYSDKGGQITETELRAALENLGIDIPDTARFTVVDEEKGKYAFEADCVIENGVLIDGELTCLVVEGGFLYQVDNALSISTLHGNTSVISSKEAYEALCAGRFSWRDVPTFNYLSPKHERVIACDLGYLTDSKGFRQPVYYFTISDENDTELRGGNGWTTFVPALER